ncbi:MAG: proline dehydrogenase family protein [Acidobacteria bacterium]|nr:proline dehydrogenase family protein [Acidobacteriota bacterium]
MFDALSKSFFHTLAGSATIKRTVSRYGMRNPSSFARRFIAGESLDEAIAAVREIERAGLMHTLDLLGESVTSIEEAAAATQAYVEVVEAVERAGIERNISLKLTQLGLDIDRATCVDNLRRILDAARSGEFFVRIDMENSPYTDVTLDIWETVWELGYRHVGVALQSYLHRSEDDMRRVNRLGGRVRLIKGAYKEPKDVAYQSKADVDACFVRMMEGLLTEGTYPAIATHDERMIDQTKAFAKERAIDPSRYEFQLLYGIRRDLQASLLAEGYNVRVYVPFGREWFPYFMRRLGERPANVGFVLRGILSER